MNYEADSSRTYDVSYYYQELVDHVTQKHPTKVLEFRLTDMPIQPFKCEKCNFYFHSKDERDNHSQVIYVNNGVIVTSKVTTTSVILYFLGSM